MPSKGRPRKSLPTTSQQSTLSFHNKPSRVTKSSATPSTTADKKAQSKLNELAQEEIIEHISEPESAETTTAQIKLESDGEVQTPAADETQAQVEEEKTSAQIKSRSKKKLRTSTGSIVSTKEEFNSLESAIAAAQKITDARIRKYWKAEEDARIAPRVHQQGLSLHEKILRHFDLSSQFGPCIGIPRLNRWNRAHTLNLEPPIEVLAVLQREEAKGTDRGDKKKGSTETRQCGCLAYVDELGGGRVVLVE